MLPHVSVSFLLKHTMHISLCSYIPLYNIMPVYSNYTIIYTTTAGIYYINTNLECIVCVYLQMTVLSITHKTKHLECKLNMSWVSESKRFCNISCHRVSRRMEMGMNRNYMGKIMHLISFPIWLQLIFTIFTIIVTFSSNSRPS